MTDQDKREKLTGIDKEIADKTLNLNKLTAEIKSREKLLNELNKTKSPNQESVIEALHRQEDEILLRDKQIIVLNERISWLEKGEYAKLVGEKDRQIAELTAQLEATSKELAEEQVTTKDYEHQLNEEKLKFARRDHEYNELQDAYKRLEEQLNDHKQAADEKPAEEEPKHDYEAEIRSLKEKIHELQIEINIGDERNEKLNEKILAFKKKKKEKDSELREVEEKLEDVQKKLGGTLLELDHIKKSQPPTHGDISQRSSVAVEESPKWAQQAQQFQTEINKLQEQLKEKDVEIKKLQEKLLATGKDIEARDHRIQELQKQLSDLHDNPVKSSDTNLNSELRGLIEEKNREIDRLQQQLEDLESQNDDKMTLLIQQEKKLRELEDTNTKLEELTIGLKEGLSQIQEKILMTGDQMAELKQALSESEHQLREARHEKTGMTKKLKDTLLDNNDMKSILGFKEAEIIKKDQAAIKMMEEINLLRQRVKQASTKLNTVVDQQLKEHERKMKEKETEIGVLKEMLKSSKTMLRYKEVEIEKLKRQFMISSDGDVKLPKINPSPMKNNNMKAEFSLQNLIPGKIESLHSAKSNQFNNSKNNINIGSPAYQEGRSHNELPIIPNNNEQGSFFSNKNDKNKILPRELDDTGNFDATYDTEKKKKKSNNIFDPNADIDFKPGDVKISPVKVTKKKKPDVSRTEDNTTPRQQDIKTPKEQTAASIPSKKLDEEKPQPPKEKKEAKSTKEVDDKKKKKTVEAEEEGSEEPEEKEDEEAEDEGEGDDDEKEEGEEEGEEAEEKDDEGEEEDDKGGDDDEEDDDDKE